ncbi:MAG: ComEC/Rec2 family competence protein [Bacillota bacterium]|nr:ComEC/Rec2 family competence protein [Bacillota bacterium]
MKLIKHKLSFILILAIIVAITSSCKFNTTQASTNKHSSDNLVVHYIDVGQGDSELIQINNKNLLIDAGTTESQQKIVSYLKKAGVNKLDYVITTHPHEDHIGGMSKVINNFDVENFYAPKVTTNTKTFSDMIKALKNKNLKIISAKAGEKLNLGQHVQCDILAPNSTKYDNLNNYSVVVKISFGNTKFLFMGDAEQESEKEMLEAGYDLSCDVLKVGHHGSKTATSPSFLTEAHPKIAVISCGKGNDYGHPHKTTLDKLNKINCTIYRTDLSGDIVLFSDGNKIVKN